MPPSPANPTLETDAATPLLCLANAGVFNRKVECPLFSFVALCGRCAGPILSPHYRLVHQAHTGSRSCAGRLPYGCAL